MGKIVIEFKENGQAEFDIQTDNDAQVFTALLSLEEYIAGVNSLPVSEIRSIMDEMKQDLKVRAKV